MSGQITIDDLRYIVAQQYKPKDESSSSSKYMNTFWRYVNNARAFSAKDAYGWLYSTSDDLYNEANRNSGIPYGKKLGREDLLYYDETQKFRV